MKKLRKFEFQIQSFLFLSILIPFWCDTPVQLTFISKFPGHELDRITGKLIQSSI